MIPNTNYSNLKDSYLFYNIAQKTKAYLSEHPDTHLYRMGIGDVSLPLCDTVIQALHKAVDDQAEKHTFHGYMPECGDPDLRKRIAEYYKNRGVELSEEEATPLSGLDPAFGDALEQLRVGQISEVVESQFGFHIIELLGKQGQLYHFRHIILKPSYTSEELTESLTTLDSLVRLIRVDSLTFEQAALEHSDDKTSKMNGGIVSNQAILERYQAFDANLMVTKFLREDFAQFSALDDYNHLIMMKEGDVSDSFLTTDALQDQLAKVVKLVKVIPTHTASLADDYLRLEQLALQAKKERVFNEWLSEKIQGMYVYIAPEFRDGEFENKNWVK